MKIYYNTKNLVFFSNKAAKHLIKTKSKYIILKYNI